MRDGSLRAMTARTEIVSRGMIARTIASGRGTAGRLGSSARWAITVLRLPGTRLTDRTATPIDRPRRGAAIANRRRATIGGMTTARIVRSMHRRRVAVVRRVTIRRASVKTGRTIEAIAGDRLGASTSDRTAMEIPLSLLAATTTRIKPRAAENETFCREEKRWLGQ